MEYKSFNERLIIKIKNAVKEYEKRIYKPAAVIEKVKGLETKEHFRTPPENNCFKDISSGFIWGGEYSNIWIKTEYTVPKSLEGKALYVREETGAREALLFANNKPVGNFSRIGASLDGLQDNAILTKSAVSGERYELSLECYAWHYETGLSAYENLGHDTADDSEFKKVFKNITVNIRNESIFKAVTDLRIALQAQANKTNEFLAARAGALLEEAFKSMILFPFGVSDEELSASCDEVIKILAPLFMGNKSGNNGFAAIIGHSHMDTAWLWPVDETIRKCARTYTNALRLMDFYPEYKFIQSSVLHTYWMEKYYPDIFAQIKQRIKGKRYEPNGAAWIECDCNITGGEYMIRQFLKGQNYLKENFGYKADAFWLPDTFGYSASIPQIMNGCGLKYFYTTKLSWNEHNKFPYESFVWRGIDGSEVITHFNITHCEPNIERITEDIHALQNKQADMSRLIAFGYGDGGGGPTEIMVETARRVKKVDGIPKVDYRTISEFGKMLEEKKSKLPVFNGELYLELHRGTLTQMHDIKRNNRKAEQAIHNMELAAVITGNDLDKKKYDGMVKCLLKNQFHDILPGTALKKVNEISVGETNELISKADKKAKDIMEKETADDGITLLNPTSFEVKSAFHISSEFGIKGAKNQLVETVSGKKLTAVSGVELSGFEAKSFDKQNVFSAASPFLYDGKSLKTPFALIEFDNDGYISSFIDRNSGRELRKENGNPLNCFYFGEDIAVYWDNWDIEYDQKFKMKPVKGFVSRQVVSDGEVEMRIRQKFKISDKSDLVQDIIVYVDSPRVDFETRLNWNDKHRLLKAGFDLDILATTAKHEIQFGYIERPTTENSITETAKFEVCNHKWTDISESRFGAAVLNDCKYGISVRESDIRLSLHRGGCRPDWSGDKGIHEFTYSLLPHGSFSVKEVVSEAYAMNYGICDFDGRLKKKAEAPVAISENNIICETVKPAENEENAYVLRLYEAEKNKTKVKLTFPKSAKKVYFTDMLEENISEIKLDNSSADLVFKPFEIITLKVFR